MFTSTPDRDSRRCMFSWSYGTNSTLKDGRKSVAAQRDEHQTKQSTQAFDKLLDGQGLRMVTE